MTLGFPRLVRGLSVVSVILLAAALSFGQEAIVTRNVNLRPDPSSTGTPIRLLTPPLRVDLVEPAKTDGYYHVRTKDGQEGWVWAKSISVPLASPRTPQAP